VTVTAPDPTALRRRSLAGIVFLHVVLAVSLFAPAGTLRYWQAWVYLGVFLGAVLAITAYFLARAPDLIERRLAAGPVAEPRPVQRLVQAIASLSFVGIFVVSGLARRLGRTPVPAAASLAADLVVAGGFAIVFLVFRENHHASALVEVGAEQRVVSTGPYGHVRHPMYAGALLLLVATPPALGSLAALPLVLALGAVIVVRLRDEEHLLSAELPGYGEYCRRVRYRLVPRVW
jgi:protein-S-isoprenylcysteine O-methyltransferase Ste14